MKKITLNSLLGLAIAIIMVILVIGNTVYDTKTVTYAKTDLTIINDTDYPVMDESINKIEEYIDLLPSNIKDKLTYTGFTIILTKKINKKCNVIGLTLYDKKEVYIKADDDAKTILHEIGHILDRYYFKVSNTDNFKYIYKSEYNTFFNTYRTEVRNIKSSSEYFAECFESYFIIPRQLEINCPETYKFIDNCLKETLYIATNIDNKQSKNEYFTTLLISDNVRNISNNAFSKFGKLEDILYKNDTYYRIKDIDFE